LREVWTSTRRDVKKLRQIAGRTENLLNGISWQVVLNETCGKRWLASKFEEGEGYAGLAALKLFYITMKVAISM
jgi:hypothetical protein